MPGIHRLPLLIQTFLLNLVGILAINWSPDGVNTSWKLFPLPPKTYIKSHRWKSFKFMHTRHLQLNGGFRIFRWIFCSTHLYNLLLLCWLNKILQNLSSDMLPLRGFWHDSESVIRARTLFRRHFILLFLRNHFFEGEVGERGLRNQQFAESHLVVVSGEWWVDTSTSVRTYMSRALIDLRF